MNDSGLEAYVRACCNISQWCSKTKTKKSMQNIQKEDTVSLDLEPIAENSKNTCKFTCLCDV